MQTIGSVVAAVAVTLVAVGATIGGAAATPRDDAVRRANDFVDTCFQYGGDPVILMDSTGESISGICNFPGGDQLVCTFNPVLKCTVVRGISSHLSSLVPLGGLTQLEPGVAAPDDPPPHTGSPTHKKHRHGGKGGT